MQTGARSFRDKIGRYERSGCRESSDRFGGVDKKIKVIDALDWRSGISAVAEGPLLSNGREA